MSLHAIVDAHNKGFAENMYLDPATRTKVEETGGANFLFITKDGTFVTPKSDSILPSITRRSLMVVAEKYLGLKVEHREVLFDEVKDFAECGLCGTGSCYFACWKNRGSWKRNLLPKAEWKKWDQSQRNCVIHLQESRWDILRDQKDGFIRYFKIQFSLMGNLFSDKLSCNLLEWIF